MFYLLLFSRYLSTGDSFQTISFSFRVGRSTVSKIAKEICIEIWNVLQPLYLPVPTQETWRQAEKGFWERWNFPNCVGSIDGKHVKIKCPPQSGSHFYCYKHFPSIVLLAVVDPRYQFLVIDVGAYGRQSDSGIFERSSFYRRFIHGKNILPPKPLPGTDIPIPRVLLGDEGFGLHTYLMRPFPKTTIVKDTKKKKFNERLSRARRVVENAFGILTQKWRIFLRPIDVEVKTATNIVKAACCLHNFVMVHCLSESCQDNADGSPDEGTDESTPALLSFTPTNRRATNAAFEVRDHFVNYFDNN